MNIPLGLSESPDFDNFSLSPENITCTFGFDISLTISQTQFLANHVMLKRKITAVITFFMFCLLIIYIKFIIPVNIAYVKERFYFPDKRKKLFHVKQLSIYSLIFFHWLG